jgi:hypothetical protein
VNWPEAAFESFAKLLTFIEQRGKQGESLDLHAEINRLATALAAEQERTAKLEAECAQLRAQMAPPPKRVPKVQVRKHPIDPAAEIEKGSVRGRIYEYLHFHGPQWAFAMGQTLHCSRGDISEYCREGMVLGFVRKTDDGKWELTKPLDCLPPREGSKADDGRGAGEEIRQAGGFDSGNQHRELSNSRTGNGGDSGEPALNGGVEKPDDGRGIADGIQEPAQENRNHSIRASGDDRVAILPSPLASSAATDADRRRMLDPKAELSERIISALRVMGPQPYERLVGVLRVGTAEVSRALTKLIKQNRVSNGDAGYMLSDETRAD